MSKDRPTDYRSAGVLANTELGLPFLTNWTNRTSDFRPAGVPGRSILENGYFANVIDLGHGRGLALTTDGVGTKVLVAEMMGDYSTIGVDCVAMNVNDLICVGAEPLAMLDYLALGTSTPELLDAIGRGLYHGAKQARISIVGGETSQMREMIRGVTPEGGLDLVGMCVGLVDLDGIIDGKAVVPGDIVIGLASSGIHCNGLTLARRAFMENGRLAVESVLPESGRTVGEELLEPTRIYNPEILDMLAQKLPIKALIHVTSDGLLNLLRIKADVGFRIHELPDPFPIFKAIQRLCAVDDAEMYRVFNMGVGFCVIVENDAGAVSAVHDTVTRHDGRSFEMGEAIENPRRRVILSPLGLVGDDERFVAASQMDIVDRAWT